MKKPVIFLAFADYRTNDQLHLRELGQEQDGIVEVLQKAEKAGLCEIIQLTSATVDRIQEIFADSTNPITIFHYGGHANGYELMLRKSAYAKGLAEFLGEQPHLKLVFLNGCSSKGHVEALHKNGVPLVVATSQSIDDTIARELAVSFYSYLGKGKSIEASFKQYDQKHRIKGTDYRAVYLKGRRTRGINEFPWKLYCKTGAEKIKEWNLPQAAGNPLFGLPALPQQFKLPPKPFRYLMWYGQKHAEIFFGRGYQIRDLFHKITNDFAPSIMLLYGRSGVGKSSLLHAGLFPRLESNHVVRYIRRNKTSGLLGSLMEGLSILEREADNLDMQITVIRQEWLAIEKNARKPLVIIIDQLEEAFTTPLPKSYFEQKRFINKESLNTYHSVELLQMVKRLFKKPSPNVVFIDPEEASAFVEHMKTIYQVCYIDRRSNWRKLLQQAATWETEQPITIIVEQVNQSPLLSETTENQQIDELDYLLYALEHIFNSPIQKPVGKVILSYRKEYHPEIEKRCSEYELPVARMFLEPLSRNDIIDAITGLTKNERTANHYQLQIEKNLPSIIANDLLEDSSSAIAPVLQILLTKMWEVTYEKQSDRPHFTIERYYRLKKEGILLQDFLEQKIEELTINFKNAVESGLVLDILKYHTTTKGTSLARKLETIKIQYSHHEENMIALLEALIQQFLLVKVVGDGYGKETLITLAHDTLAPLVTEMYEQSDLPGPTAQRILTNRLKEVGKTGKITDLELGKTDLILVEEGKLGMRNWLPEEKELVNFSQKRRAEELHKRKKSKLFALVGRSIIFVLACIAIVGWWWAKIQTETAEVETQNALSYYLASEANSLLHTDPTKSFKLAEYAYDLMPNVTNKSVLQEAYHNHVFYKSVPAHKSSIYTVTFSPSDSLLLTASNDGAAKVLDLQGKVVCKIKDNRPLAAARFSPNGEKIVTCSSKDITIKIWSKEGDLLHILDGHFGDVNDVRYSPSGKYLLSAANDNQTILWDAEKLKKITIAKHDDDITQAIFTPDEKFILTASKDRTVKLWEIVPDGELKLRTTLTDFQGSVSSIAISKNQQYIITTSGDNTLRIWFMDEEKNIQLLADRQLHGPVHSACFAPNDDLPFKLAVSCESGEVLLLDRLGHTFKTLEGHTDRVNSVTFSASGEYIATASQGGEVKIWNLKHQDKPVLKHAAPIRSCAFSNDGQYVVTASWDNRAIVWDLKGRKIKSLIGHRKGVVHVEFSPDDCYILTTSFDKTAKIWDWENGRVVTTINGHKNEVASGSFSANGLYIATASYDKIVKIWSWNEQEVSLKTELLGHSSRVNAVDFSPNRPYIITASSDKTAKLWNLNGVVLASIEAHIGAIKDVKFSKDGQYIATAATDKTARIWKLVDAKNKIEIIPIALLDGHTNSVRAVEFSPDERFVATASFDNTVRIWELTGDLLYTITPSKNWVHDVSFDPLGQYIITASEDAETRVWIRDFDKMIGDVADMNVSYLSKDDMVNYNLYDINENFGIDPLLDLYESTDIERIHEYAHYYTKVGQDAESFTEAAPFFDKAIRLFKRLITLEGEQGEKYAHKLIEMYKVMSGYCKQKQNLYKGITYIDAAIELQKTIDEAEHKDELVTLLAEKGNYQLLIGKYQAALQTSIKAYNIAPISVAQKQLAHAYLYDWQFNEAALLYLAYQQENSLSNILSDYATFVRVKQKPPDMSDIIRLLIGERPFEPQEYAKYDLFKDSLFNIQPQQHLKEVLNDLSEEARLLHETLTVARKAIYHNNKSAYEEAIRMYEKMMQLYKKLISNYEKETYTLAYIELSKQFFFLMYDQNQFEKAAQYQEEVLTTIKSLSIDKYKHLYIDAYLRMAKYLLFIGKTTASLDFSQKAIALNDQKLISYVNMGHAYLLQGNIAQAKEMYNKVKHKRAYSWQLPLKYTIVKDWEKMSKNGITLPNIEEVFQEVLGRPMTQRDLSIAQPMP